MAHHDSVDPNEQASYALEQITGWYRRMSQPIASHAPDSLFEDLRLIKRILAALLKGGEIDFKASIDSSTILAYQQSMKAFTSKWEAAAKDAVDCRFKQLREAMRSGLIYLKHEHAFHEAAYALESLTSQKPSEADVHTWQKYVPIFLAPAESERSLRQLQQHYQEFQHKVYSNREDTKLWLLIWRTLKLAYVVSRPEGYKFPRMCKTAGFIVEQDFFAEPGIRECFKEALPEMGSPATELVELLVVEYCKNVYAACKTDDPSFHAYHNIPTFPLSPREVRLFNKHLLERSVSPKLLYLVHRATFRLAFIKSQEDLVWIRTATEGTTWPILCARSEAFDAMVLDRKAVDLEHTVNAKLFAKPAGHSRISAFDYVHYPFPETRAHEVAASEQITRELGSPGIFSDGARVQHVVNRPPRHVLPPSYISSWATWRLRGPLGFLCYVLSSRWRSRNVKSRPDAKPRAVLTYRSEMKQRHVSPLLPTKDSTKRIDKIPAMASVPKLRGGGGKASLHQPRTLGSPSRPTYSSITENGIAEQTVAKSEESARGSVTNRSTSPSDGIEQLLTTAEKDKRLREFKEMTGTDSKPAYHNERFINEFLEPNGWDVEVAMEAYVESVANRQKSRNTENSWRPNAASPTPKQRTPPPAVFYDPYPSPSLAPPRQASTESQSLAVRNTTPRPGTYDDIHDDSSSSDSSDIDNSDDVGSGDDSDAQEFSRTGQNHIVESDPDGGDDSVEDGIEEHSEDHDEAIDKNDDSSWNISSRFIDPSLVQGGNIDTPNTNSQGAASNGENELHNAPEDEETSDMYGDGLEDDEIMEEGADEDHEAQNEDGVEPSDHEHVPPLSMRDRFGPHPLFDTFEDDVPADTRRGNAPSAGGNDSLFSDASGAQHRDADQPYRSVEEGSEPELPPQPTGAPDPPQGLEGRRRSDYATGPHETELGFSNTQEDDEDDEDDEDYQPPPENGSHSDQVIPAYADVYQDAYNDTDATESENDENHPPAPIVPRQPLGVLEDRDPSLPRSGRLSPHAPGRELPCHPCPVYAGEYHHNCRCHYELRPPPPYIHRHSPAPGLAQRPLRLPSSGQSGNGTSPPCSPPSGRRDLSHPLIVRRVPLPDPFADDANSERQPSSSRRHSRSIEDGRTRRRRIREGKRAIGSPRARATPRARSERSQASRLHDPTPPTRRRLWPQARPDSEPDLRQSQISESSSPILQPGDIKQQSSSNAPVTRPSSNIDQPGPSRIKKRSSSERKPARGSGGHRSVTSSEARAAASPDPPAGSPPTPRGRRSHRTVSRQPLPLTYTHPAIAPVPSGNPTGPLGRRRIISMQTYLDTMFRDEMMAELDARQVAYRVNATAAALAARLHQADNEDNLGMGNMMAFRVIARKPEARQRPKGWTMPARPAGR